MDTDQQQPARPVISSPLASPVGESDAFYAQPIHAAAQLPFAATMRRTSATDLANQKMDDLLTLKNISGKKTKSAYPTDSTHCNAGAETTLSNRSQASGSRLSTEVTLGKRSMTYSCSTENSRSRSKISFPGPLKFSIEDFAGIEQLCQNGGSSTAGLAALVQKCSNESNISLSLIWSNLTTNYVSTTEKYCTPSSVCTEWYCSCDRNVRYEYASKNVLGVLVITQSDKSSFFVPLCECAGSPATSRQSDHIILPLNCQTSEADRWDAVQEILKTESVTKVIFNAQLFLLPFIYRRITFGDSYPDAASILCNAFDPKVAAYVCNTSVTESELELCALRQHISCDLSSLMLEEEKQAYALSRSMGSISKVLLTALTHAKVTVALQKSLIPIMTTSGLSRVFSDIEMPLVSVLACMEGIGVMYDEDLRASLQRQLSSRILNIEREIFECCGRSFNVASPEQVSMILFDHLKLPISGCSSTPKGRHHSTSEEDLNKLIALHPSVGKIIAFRHLSKILTTYLEGYKQFVCREQSEKRAAPFTFTGTAGASTHSAPSSFVVHANWNQTVVRTGRLSCSKPNLQNIPNTQTIAGEEINMRSIICAAEGHVLIAADYSQIEMRMLAHLSGDPQLSSLFHSGGDVYKLLASQIFKKPLSRVSAPDRERAKTICLGVIYGMGPAAAAAKLHIEVSEARDILNKFMSAFPVVRGWLNDVKVRAKHDGFVSTMIGRRRNLPDLNSADQNKRQYAERQAVNSVIQGSASDLIKSAMLILDRIQFHGLPPRCHIAVDTLPVSVHCIMKARLVMQIHDELIYEVAFEHAENFTAMLASAMVQEVSKHLGLNVPLQVNIYTGRNWGALQASDSI